MVVTIEHCSDCSKHPTTRHDEGKYSDTAEDVKNAIAEAFPFVEVHVKPTNTLKIGEAPMRKDGRVGWVISKDKKSDSITISERHPSGISLPTEDAYRSERLGAPRELLSHRLGAFEVQLAIRRDEEPSHTHLIFSKLLTRQFPRSAKEVPRIVDEIKRLLLEKVVAHQVHVACFDYVNDAREPRVIPTGVKLEAAAGEVKCSVDVPEGPYTSAEGGGVTPDLSGAEVYLKVPMCCKAITFPGSADLCASAVPISEDSGQSASVELNFKPRCRCVLYFRGNASGV